MGMKYKLHGPWQAHDIVGPVEVEVADLIDGTGHVWAEGAYRVKYNGKVRKTFKGETAWADGARLANELYYGWRLSR